jgi:predicted PhzF superfamily epimerase YddE/YHI9
MGDEVVALTLSVVDAFTDRPFSGNPAAVAVLDAFPGERAMQLVAREMALSETAFVVPRPAWGGSEFELRWFTPVTEVDLCGHATVAAASLLGGAPRFHTRSGILACRAEAGGWISVRCPADRPVPAALPPELHLPGLVWSGRGRSDLVLVLDDADAVRSYTPDIGALAGAGTRMVIVTAPGDLPGVDMVSRAFAPNAGIPEDPVTGSAHCTLAGYWSERLGRTRLVGVQVSHRPGTVRMAVEGSSVVISGQAVSVAEVTMALPSC